MRKLDTDWGVEAFVGIVRFSTSSFGTGCNGLRSRCHFRSCDGRFVQWMGESASFREVWNKTNILDKMLAKGKTLQASKFCIWRNHKCKVASTDGICRTRTIFIGNFAQYKLVDVIFIWSIRTEEADWREYLEFRTLALLKLVMWLLQFVLLQEAKVGCVERSCGLFCDKALFLWQSFKWY